MGLTLARVLAPVLAPVLSAPLLASLRAPLRDRRGVAALEFALVVPVLLTLWMSLVELDRLVTAHRKVMKVAQVTADLVAQDSAQTSASLTAIASAAQYILMPLPSGTDRLGMTITSVGYADPGGATGLLWSFSVGPPVALDLSATAAMGAPGESVIQVGVSYRYTSPFGFLLGDRAIGETAIARPRIARRIALNGSTGP